MGTVSSLADLERLYRRPAGRALLKQLDHLDRHCRHFISLSPFLVLATGGPHASLDASPRGGPPGFVHVPDDRTLLLPDWPGNNRLDSLRNILESPGVALLFVIPGVDETLRVAGRAEIRSDGALRGRFRSSADRLPATVLRIEVREAFLQCAKSLMRAGLWDPGRHLDRSALPTMGEMLKDQIGDAGQPETQQAMLARYRANLF